MKHFKPFTLACQTLTAIVSLVLATPAALSLTTPQTADSDSLADILGWVAAPQDICGGYYQEPAIVHDYPSPLPAEQQVTNITSDQGTYSLQTGRSILQGNVVVTQPGREVTADVAHLYRDPTSGQLQTIDLAGNVHFREAEKLVVAKEAHIDFRQKIMTLGQVIYRFVRQFKGQWLDGWGTAKTVHRTPEGVLKLQQATYTTCPPTQHFWQVKASHLNLDKENGWGSAFNSRLDVWGVPVFYTPYFTFPLDDRRKTGFLFPTFNYSSTNGVELTTPFYLNLAPNYDATITPHLIGKRGLQHNLLYRYLTQRSHGDLNLSFLPSDKLFAQFQNDAPQILQNTPNSAAYLSRIEKANTTRGFYSFNNATTFNPHWSTELNLNYATDDYYFQDFGSTADLTTNDQLLNRGKIHYQTTHWRFTGLLQGYETLHPYNEPLVQDQYSRLPELDLSGDFPSDSGGLDYYLENQLVNFDKRRDFITGDAVPTGTRFHLQPSVRWPIERPQGYFTPELQLATTFYSLQNQPFGTPTSINREIPLFDIDSGLYFDRALTIGQHHLRQTLEPRVFYLFVPNVNQSDIPEFDTTLPPFTISQLFSANRFVGVDRVGDANQVSVGFTSRLLDDYSNVEKAHVSFVEAFYLNPRHVFDITQDPHDPLMQEHTSPLVGELSYNLTPQWNLLSNAAWDANRRHLSNGNVGLTYSPDSRHIFTIGYNFVQGGDVIDPNDPSSAENDLDRINIGAAFPLSQRWSAVGNWNYNISHGHPQAYFYGLEYQSCCWAVRMVASRIITAENLGNSQFENDFYVQFQLKGLGNFGNSDPGGLLAGGLPGYQDRF